MPVVVFAGESELMKDEKVSTVKKDFEEHVRIHPEDREKISVLRSKIGNVGIFGKRVLVEVLDFDSWKAKERKEALEILKNVPEEVLVILRAKNPIKGFKVERFELPKPWERDKWREYVRRMFSRYDLKISSEVLEYFLDVVGTDEYRIRSEIEKLSLYCDGEVKVSDIDEIVHKSVDVNVEELAFAISELRFEEAHRLVPEVLRNNDPILVVAVLSKHFIDLFKILSKIEVRETYTWPQISKISKELSLSVPKVARFLGFSFKGWKFKPKNHVKLYDLETVGAILKHLYTLDRMVKSSDNAQFHIHTFIENVRREIDVRDSGETHIG